MPFLTRLPVRPSRRVRERVDQLELPFGPYGVDPYGIDKRELARFFTALRFLYESYFSVHVHGIEHVPPRGRAMLVGNHSGGVGIDGVMVIASCFFAMEPPRLAQGMADKFLNKIAFSSPVTSRIGQFTGLPEHAVRLLEDERLLMVFPEGTRGTAKLYPERHSLVAFGSGFMRLALQARAPIVPLAFVGGGEAVPTIANLYRVGRALGLPYFPITPYGLPVPLPVRVDLLYGEPMTFDCKGDEVDDVINHCVDSVRDRIALLIQQGRDVRAGRIHETEIRFA